MPTLKIDGITVEVPAGVPIIEAAKKAGCEVPYFCYHDKLSRPANCRQCLVEVAKAPKLVPACYTTVAEGMEISTKSPRVQDAQRSNMEFLLLNHPVDCPICDQAGECKLQDYYRDYDFKPSRLNVLPNHKPKVVRLGAKVVLDAERCVLCTRCIRFYEEIVHERPIGVFKRGNKSEIAVYPGHELQPGYARNIVDICPVGALTSEDFRFKKRVWFLDKTESVCTGCATGCNISLEHHEGVAYRNKPRENADVNECWICDDGAYSYKRINDERVLAPTIRGASGPAGDAPGEVTWAEALAKAAELLRAPDGGRPVGIVLSPQASVEDTWAWLRLGREALGGDVRWYVGGKALWKGDDVLRSVDQNPNTLGAKLIAGVLGGKPGLLDAAALKADLEGNKLRTLVLIGGDLPDAKLYDSLRKAPALIHVGTHVSPAVAAAQVFLPGVTHAEKEGVFVNGEGRAQRFHQAMEPRGRAAPEWKIALKLAGKLGVDFAWAGPQALFQEIAEQVPAFAGQSYATLGAQGAVLAGFALATASATPTATP